MTHVRQRFSLFDLLSLVTACGIACALILERQRQWAALGVWPELEIISAYWICAGILLSVGTYCLGFVTLYRRPSRENVARSPGRAAVLAICCVSLLLIFIEWDWIIRSALPWPATLAYLPFGIATVPIAAATAAYSTRAGLLIAATPKNPTDWIDRAGRFWSILWLIHAVVQPIANIR